MKQAKYHAGGIESDSLDIVLGHLKQDLPQGVIITNELAQIEAIRKRALAEILALGFTLEEVQVDIGLTPGDSNALYKLAEALGWKASYHWYESPEKTEGGEVTVYFEPPEQVW